MVLDIGALAVLPSSTIQLTVLVSMFIYILTAWPCYTLLILLLGHFWLITTFPECSPNVIQFLLLKLCYLFL